MDKARILTYHRVGIPRTGRYERMTVPPGRFARQMGVMRLLRYRFSDLDAVAAWLKGEHPRIGRPIVLTFDDAYADLYDHACPLLLARGVPAVVFVVAGREADVWMERGENGPLPLMGWPQVREMADAGIVFGSHTLTHARLTRCSQRELEREVADSKKMIEDRTGRQVRHFCYPYGDCDDRVVDAVREAGYVSACTTRKGAVLPGADPLRLPRLTVGKRMGMRRFLFRLMLRH